MASASAKMLRRLCLLGLERLEDCKNSRDAEFADTAYVGQEALRALLGHLVRQGNARNVIAQAYTSYTMVRHRTSWRAVASASAKKMPTSDL